MKRHSPRPPPAECARFCRRAFACLCLLLAPSATSAQILISTGASSGLRLFAPNAVDWWFQPFGNQLTLSANGATSSPFLTVLSNGNVGISTGIPTAALDVNGGVMHRSSATWAGISAPQKSVAGQGAIYFDSGSHQFMVSQNGASYIPLGGQTAGGWTEGGGLVELSTPTDSVLIQSTMAVAGNFFSVGTSTFVVTGGNVGIGTTNPSTTLHVGPSAGPLPYGPVMTIQGDSSAREVLHLYSNFGTAGMMIGSMVQRMLEIG